MTVLLYIEHGCWDKLDREAAATYCIETTATNDDDMQILLPNTGTATTYSGTCNKQSYLPRYDLPVILWGLAVDHRSCRADVKM